MFLLLFFTAWTHAQSLNQNMMEVAGTMRELIPFMVSQEKFSNPSHEQKISEKLARLQNLFVQNRAHFLAKGEERKVTREMMLAVLGETRRFFLAGKKEVARQMLKSSPELCLTCHTQDQFSAKILEGMPERFSSDLETAEFYMITRRPQEAEKYLATFLASPDKRNLDQEAQALRDELRLAIHQRQPWSEIKGHFEKRKKVYGNRPGIGVTLDSWLQGIRETEKAFSAPLRNIQEVGPLMRRAQGGEDEGFGLMAEGPREVLYMKLRIEIHGLMAKGMPEKDLPEAFYWLSLGERAVGYNAFYSLADAYLKTCITHWPKNSFARKCLAEYEDFINFAYSGSSGTHIPSDVQAELRRLHKLLGQDGPKF